MAPFVSLLEIHKLMYFMKDSGEKLELKLAKGPYRPYEENLRHVLTAIEGHFLTGYGDAEDGPGKEIRLLLDALPAAQALLAERAETAERFRRVSELIEGFESSYGMELLATVHWVATKEGADSIESVVAGVHGWNERKKMFPPVHVEAAYRVLQERGWLGE